MLGSNVWQSIAEGVSVILHLSLTPNGKQKFKLTMNPSVGVATHQSLLHSTLEHVDALCRTHVVVDRGHKHSNYMSETCF